ncbi:MAG: RusA family crossover junction endodeoxyribonuclease [Caulobacteraceae bacterium]|nr:RusA family crossover junction endodeoxyribonuclease [Caulobacteraceae bacterium]
MVISFTVPGEPVAQPRVKAVNQGGFTRVYTPATAKPYKEAVRMVAMGHWRIPPASGPVIMHIDFLFARPKSITWKRRAMPRRPHTKKPDLDNLAKAVLDALNGLLFFDDSQVVRLVLNKSYVAGGEEPHTVITITEVSNVECVPGDS